MQQVTCFWIDRRKQRELLSMLCDRRLVQQDDCRQVGGGVVCVRNEYWSVGESTNRLPSLGFSLAESILLRYHSNLVQVTQSPQSLGQRSVCVRDRALIDRNRVRD